MNDDEPVSKLDHLKSYLRGIGPVVVAFSGGADSAFLASVARSTLGRHDVLAVTAVSPSLASDERHHCAQLAEDWDLEWVEVFTDEMTNAAYRANAGDRCAHCKDALMDAVEPVATAGQATVVLGVNVDDLGDHRPGQEAAAARGAVFPLVETNWRKDEIRQASRALGLSTWDKPAAPCLASRLPYGIPVTLGRLSAVERAEAALRGLGFRDLRVRHYESTARLEFPLTELDRAFRMEAQLTEVVRAVGYRDAVIDPLGLRSGNLNEALDLGGPDQVAVEADDDQQRPVG